MPQVTNGQVQGGQNGAPQLYGTKPIENALPFQERLMNRFQPQEYVIVKNIDDEPVYWQYLPAHAEEKQFTQDGMQQVTTRKQPEMWVIAPGQTEVLVGASAYLALDCMYKNYASKAILRKSQDPNSRTFDEKGSHLPKNFNFADGGAQEDFIEKAYLGKANPTFDVPQSTTPAVATKETSSVGSAK